MNAPAPLPAEVAAIRERRRVLLARIESERAALAGTVADLSLPVAAADRVVGAVRYVRKRPLLGAVLAAMAGLAGARLGRRLRRAGVARMWWLPGIVSLALDVGRALRERPTRDTRSPGATGDPASGLGSTGQGGGADRM